MGSWRGGLPADAAATWDPRAVAGLVSPFLGGVGSPPGTHTATVPPLLGMCLSCAGQGGVWAGSLLPSPGCLLGLPRASVPGALFCL